MPGLKNPSGLNDSTQYPGKELSLFARAKTWKSYWASMVGPFIRGRVLDVGSGIGGNVNYFFKSSQSIRQLTLLEPDASLYERIRIKIAGWLERGLNVQGINLTLEKLIHQRGGGKEKDSLVLFDAIVYADVLEHIEDDAYELSMAKSVLEPGGYIVVLAPAHNWLRSKFDDSVGHYRRYDQTSLRSLETRDMRLEKVIYLDSLGLFLSILNKYVLKQDYPSMSQIMIWDQWVVRASKILDRLLGFRVGKSIIAVYRKV